MRADQFDSAAAKITMRPKTREACRLVLVEGLSCYAAAKRTGIEISTITRAVARMKSPVCPACGRPR